MASYQFGAETFSSKSAVEDRCREIRERNPLFTPLGVRDHVFLAALLAQHPDSADKIGPGVDHFEVGRNELGQVCLWVWRADGSGTDFSWKKCLTPPSPWREFCNAARTTICDQTQAVKDAAFVLSDVIVCPVLGIVVSRAEAHVDHVAPLTFDALLREFVALRALDVATVPLSPRGPGVTTRRLVGPVADDWAEYHRTHAVLRVVSARANTGVLRRGQ